MLPSLKETFSRKDKNPFGGFILFNQLQQVFYHNNFYVEKQNFETSWQNITDTASLYISVSKNLYLSEAAQKAMLNYVSNGNTLFISSENIDSTLLDSLGCKEVQSFGKSDYLENMRYTAVRLDSAAYYNIVPYTYYYYPFFNHFIQYDSTVTNVLGTNEIGKANFVEIFYGRGRVYLHCEPRALSNYFLLQKQNYLYLQNLFTFINRTPEHIYWDDYYNKRNRPSAKDSKNAFQLLLQYPATAGAFWIVLCLLLLYILFGGKRRQRIVEAIQPNVNTTVAFTETIGRLYLQKKDNRNIAAKMIMYFQEHIRKQYFLNTSHVNDDFITTLSRKSDVPKEITAGLFKLISELQEAPEISDEQLLFLNRQIDIFYKKNQ
ncbi:hypothetical protein BH11BAC5_BH11BAC5_11770 [soil metagenome]